jgi:hypothetical protein
MRQPDYCWAGLTIASEGILGYTQKEAKIRFIGFYLRSAIGF